MLRKIPCLLLTELGLADKDGVLQDTCDTRAAGHVALAIFPSDRTRYIDHKNHVLSRTKTMLFSDSNLPLFMPCRLVGHPR